MPKRSASEKIERYNKKIRKLEQQNSRRLARVIESSESDHNNENDADTSNINDAPPPPSGSVVQDIISPESEPGPSVVTTETPAVPDLDPDILQALGESMDDTPEFGEKIHENLAQRWLPILKRGLGKEVKDKLLKEYLVPNNCTLLQAPKLNVEISAAITDIARHRDKKMEVAQQILGIGITAINRAMTVLVTGNEKIEAIKMLSDSCRILSDLHFINTQARIKMLTPGLDKAFLNVVKDTERDVNLFGTKLSEKIKASKTIEKQGLQIKKPVVTHKPPTATVQSTVVRPRYQENWVGPSRYPSNKGGRGGPRRQFPAARKPAQAPVSVTHSRFSNPSKSRPPQQ